MREWRGRWRVFPTKVVKCSLVSFPDFFLERSLGTRLNDPLLPPSIHPCAYMYGVNVCGYMYGVYCCVECVCVMCTCVHTCVSLCVYEMVYIYALIFEVSKTRQTSYCTQSCRSLSCSETFYNHLRLALGDYRCIPKVSWRQGQCQNALASPLLPTLMYFCRTNLHIRLFKTQWWAGLQVSVTVSTVLPLVLPH